MSAYVNELKKTLDQFEKNVDAKIETMRQYKNEIQALTEVMHTTTQSGQFIRDQKRIILSAPEIIIGNLDHDGVLLGDGGSVVTVRGNSVALEGTGSSSEGGNLTMRASSIRQLAVDPGKDGLENVVSEQRSEILTQAKSICIRSDDVTGTFIESPTGGVPGISVHSDTFVSVDAAPSCQQRKTVIAGRTKEIDTMVSSLSEKSKTYKNRIDDILKQMDEISDTQEEILESEYQFRNTYQESFGLHDRFAALESELSSAVASYVSVISRKAELKREKEDLKAMKKDLEEKSSQFKTASNGSFVRIFSEQISLNNMDGDRNLKENEEARVLIHSPHVSVRSIDKNEELIKGSTVTVNSQNVDISTATTKMDKKKKNGTVEAIGDITVTSKNLTVQSVDDEVKNGERKEKALTKGGTVDIRAEKISATATDAEGKSTGSIKVNAKKIQVASMDVDKEKRTDKEMASGSEMILLSEKIYTGSLDSGNKSRLVQVVSDKVAIIADSTAEMQQGEGKAVVTLDGGNVTAGGSRIELDGDTTIKGKADIKGDVEAPNGKFKGLEAKGKFTSANISDGMMGGTAAAAARPSAKMKMEEAE